MSLIRNIFFIVFLFFLSSACKERTPINDVEPEATDFNRILITSTPEPLELTPLSTETPVLNTENNFLVEVVEIEYIAKSDGTDRIVGLVTNNTDYPVTNVNVHVQIFSVNNTLVFEDFAPTSLSTIKPGGTSPFVLWLTFPLQGEISITGEVIKFAKTEIRSVEVIIRKQSITMDDNNNIHVIGDILNNNLTPIEIQSFATAVFGIDGNLLNADSQSVFIQYLDPGETSPFRTTIQEPVDISLDITHYKVFVDSRITNPEDYLDIQINYNLNHYIDRFGVFHLVGEITNNSKERLNVNFVAAIYDSLGHIIDASKSGVILNSLPPGETFPIDFTQWGPLNFKKGTATLGHSFSVQWDPYLTWSSVEEYVDLQINDEAQQLNPLFGVFDGTLINATEFHLSSAIIIVSIYDQKTGYILATKTQEYVNDIPPGGSINYSLESEFQPNLNLEGVEIRLKAFGMKSE